MSTWASVRLVGAAGALLGRDPPDPLAREVWVCTVTRPALVLGSTQPIDEVDIALARRLEIEIVQRRSGGGAVLLEPGAVLWTDVFLPRDDPLWLDDVSRSGYWLGEAWVRALDEAGVEAEVHRGGADSSVLARRVCFGGIGPGEAHAGGKKVVGVSQRRWRAGARFQCLVLDRWEPTLLGGLLGLGPGQVAALTKAATGVGVVPAGLAGLERSFLRALPV